MVTGGLSLPFYEATPVPLGEETLVAGSLLCAFQMPSQEKMFLRIEPCTPQLASTTWVTPKSAATDIKEIASSSLSLCTVIRKRRSLRKASRIARSRLE